MTSSTVSGGRDDKGMRERLLQPHGHDEGPRGHKATFFYHLEQQVNMAI
jgi:hypothetical protein